MTEEVIELIEDGVTPVINEMEIEITEAIGWAASDMNMHSNLPDRNAPNQHLTSAITGLDEQLAQIKAPRVLYSNKSGVAHYYEWESGAYDEAGYFVSLVPGSSKIKICDGTNIFGVTVKEAGFAGNQDTTALRSNNYGLVITSGLVDVRCTSGINIGDNVVANNTGLAVKTDSDCGYKVISKETKDGTEYVSISLGVQACTTNLLGLRVSTLEQGLEDAERNILAAMAVANEAALKAGTSDIASSETLEKIDGVIDATNSMQDTIDQSIKDIEETKQATEQAVGQAVNKANDALARANEVEASLDTKASVMEVETLESEHRSLIEQNAKSYSQLVASVDKYCIGELSQSYGLSVEQARKILNPDMIYIPITDIDTHKEVYVVTVDGKEYSFEKEFTEGSYYIWEPITFTISTADGEKDISGYWWNEYLGEVWVNRDQPSGTAYEFWFDNTTLYKQENEQWLQVNTLAGNVNSRISSLIRQDVDSIAAEVVNAHGSIAAFEARLTETESETQQLSSWKTSEEENMAVVRTEATENGTQVIIGALSKDNEGEVTEAATLRLEVAKDKDGNPTSNLKIAADSIQFTTEDYKILADEIALEGLVTVADLEGKGTTTINGSNITTGVIQSENYKNTDGAEGMQLNLEDGTIESTNFVMDATGKLSAKGVNIEGTINAQNGQIGVLTIDDGVVEMAGKPNLVKGYDQVVTSSAPIPCRYYLLPSASEGVWDGQVDDGKIGALVAGRTYTVQMDITPNENVEYMELRVSNNTYAVCQLPIDVNKPTSRQIITQTFTFEGYPSDKTPELDPTNAMICFNRFPDPSESGGSQITIHRIKIEEGSAATSFDVIMRLNDTAMYIKGEIEATSGNIGCLKIGEGGEVYYEDGNTKSFYIKPGLGVNITTGFVGGWTCSDDTIRNNLVTLGSGTLSWGSDKFCSWSNIIDVCKDGGLYEQLKSKYDTLQANYELLYSFAIAVNEDLKRLGNDFNEYKESHP